MVNHFVEEIKRKHSKDVSSNKNALYELRTACEKAKRFLTSSDLAHIGIRSLLNGFDFKSSITRARFEELNSDLFLSTIDFVVNALHDADMTKTDIQDVVLVGGSTRIPKIQKMVREFFNGMDLIRSINPDEAVAHGATIQAAILQGHLSEAIKNLSLFDVTPLSLGIETGFAQVMSTVVQRNTPIPTRITEQYCTVKDNQNTVAIKVYEGERPLTKNNNLLGKFFLNGIPASETIIDVTFEIEAVRKLEN